MIQYAESKPSSAKIKVVGVGGAGGNALNAMIRAGLSGVEFIAINTDMQALDANLAQKKIQIGKASTRGLGAGANPELGEEAVLEDKEEIIAALSESDMVFITAGMGGGTGTGGAHVIAEIARSINALTVAIVTRPFTFEGPQRQRKAIYGLDRLKENVDTLIVIPNDKIIEQVDRNTPILDAFLMADDILLQATRGISDLITSTGYINLDFADVKAIMSEMGDALMGSGVASGPDRATIASQQAISSPLLDGVSIEGALGVLINITGNSRNLTIQEVTEAATMVQEQAGVEANVIFGMSFDDSLNDEIRITVIATGFNAEAKKLKRLKESKTQPIATPAVKPMNTYRIKPEFRPKNTQIHMTLFDADEKAEEVEKQVKQQVEEIKNELKSSDEFSRGSSLDDLDIPTFLRKSMD